MSKDERCDAAAAARLCADSFPRAAASWISPPGATADSCGCRPFLCPAQSARPSETHTAWCVLCCCVLQNARDRKEERRRVTGLKE